MRGDGGAKKIAVVLHIHKTQPWGEYVKADFVEAFAEHPAVRYEFVTCDEGSEQLRILDRYLTQGVDGLIFAPLDPPRVRARLSKYRAAGIPVVLVDNDVEDPALYDAIVMADHRHIGRMAGQFFVEAMQGRGDVVEIHGRRTDVAAVHRSEGFRQAVAGYPQLRIVGEVPGEWLYERASSEFARALARHRRIDGVFAQNDDMGRAAFEAAAAVGREDEMLITGVDAVPGENGTIRLVTQGVLAASFLNPSPGRDAVFAMMAILKGESYLKRTLLKTSTLRSKERIRRWQSHRR